jgi:hypothetical protein
MDGGQHSIFDSVHSVSIREEILYHYFYLLKRDRRMLLLRAMLLFEKKYYITISTCSIVIAGDDTPCNVSI